MIEIIQATLGMVSKLATKINSVIFNTDGVKDSISETYDSTSTTSNRDGNLFQRTEYIIDSLLGAPPVRVNQSLAPPVSEGTYSYYSVQVYDIDGNPYLAEDIDITLATLVLEKSTLGGAFSIVGITQPTVQKGLGHIDTSILFKIDEWTPDDLYRLTLSGVTVINGVTHTLQTFVWNNTVTIINDIDAEVDTILEHITVPAIDNVDNTSIADIIGTKGDTPKTDLTATIMNNLKALFASSLSKRIRISEVVDATSFRTTDLPALGNGGLIGWYVFCSIDAGGLGGAPQGEYRLITSWSNGLFTHNAFSTLLTTSDKVMIVHPSIYNMVTMMPEIAKIQSIKTTVEAITDYALEATSALIQTETDKIQSIKDTVEAITGYALEATHILIQTETDKIQSIKNTVEAITGYALEATSALIKAETDKIQSIVNYVNKSVPLK